ncbi:MAG: ATP-dependent DNA helicase RecQ [Bacteroidota bacterium]
MSIHQILVKYWGYQSFRPMQEDIIQSVLSGNDTLALLPTGGGKSLCFQVPALAKEGLCLVISPLIALMKDQVENLKKKGIPAVATYSGMHFNEVDLALDNCVHGNIKLLYISPERLASETFRVRLKKMKINLIAVDEAHCVSQWGYDFRPPYLRIAEIREYFPGVPLLALTATATPDVVDDIQNKLLFKKKNVLSKSFERKNLSYAVIKEEDKFKRLLNIISKISGSGIIYVRNRRRTREIAEFLNKNGISSLFYHAGLDYKTRDTRQNEWMAGARRVIVATNAFGMGIDKPDVRFVIHFDVPNSPEAYFQEAGRGGRDDKKAYAMMIYFDSDIFDAQKNIEESYPPVETIRNVYNCLGNYYNLALGSGKDASFDFDISAFSSSYNLKPVTVYNSLKFLEKEGYVLATDGFYQPSQLRIIIDKEGLYRFQVENKVLDNFIRVILRSYGGIFTDFVKVHETEIAARAGITKERTIENLKHIEKAGVISYIPQKEKPQIIFCSERLDQKSLYISPENYHERKKIAEEKMNAMIRYVSAGLKCRSQLLLEYFGEKNPKRCGQCDVCLERNKLDMSEFEFNSVIDTIKPLLQQKAYSLEEVVNLVKDVNEKNILRTLRWLIDNDKIIIDENQNLKWNKK